MANFKLDSTHDLEIVNNNLVIVDGLDAIVQDCDTRLKTFFGEYFLDQRIGVPYFQKILGQKPRINVIRSIMRKAIFTTPGISQIFDLQAVYNGVDRSVNVTFRAETIEGPFAYNSELIV